MSRLKDTVEELLREAKVNYHLIEMPPDIAMDVDVHMKFHGKDMSKAMTNMVFKTEKGFIVAQRRGDTGIDSKKLRKLLGVQRLSLASPEELESLGLKAGLVPPMGFAVPFYMDKRVLENDEVYTGTGDVLYAIRLSPKDIVKINKATIGDFTMKNSFGKKRVYSGIRATGRLHLGNYFGAIKGMLALQDEYDCVFSVVDLHAITTPYDPKTLQQSIREVVLDFLAAGLDPKKCLLEIQSKVPQHTELSFLLATIYPLSRVEDLPTFKEKKLQHPKYVNVGLLYYPILMAADILLYKAEVVPAGIDQEPHIEVTREIARKFNQMFGMTFPETHRVSAKSDYVPSLTGEGKMSKTVEGSFITLMDDLPTIKKRLAQAPTDSGTVGGEVPKEGGVTNLFTLLKLFVSQDVHNKFVQDYRNKNIRYGDMKNTLAEAIYQELKPFQEKRKEFEQNPKLVDEILEESNKKCRQLAEETMREVKQKMGLS